MPDKDGKINSDDIEYEKIKPHNPPPGKFTEEIPEKPVKPNDHGPKKNREAPAETESAVEGN